MPFDFQNQQKQPVPQKTGFSFAPPKAETAPLTQPGPATPGFIGMPKDKAAEKYDGFRIVQPKAPSETWYQGPSLKEAAQTALMGPIGKAAVGAATDPKGTWEGVKGAIKDVGGAFATTGVTAVAPLAAPMEMSMQKMGMKKTPLGVEEGYDLPIFGQVKPIGADVMEPGGFAKETKRMIGTGAEVAGTIAGGEALAAKPTLAGGVAGAEMMGGKAAREGKSGFDVFMESIKGLGFGSMFGLGAKALDLGPAGVKQELSALNQRFSEGWTRILNRIEPKAWAGMKQTVEKTIPKLDTLMAAKTDAEQRVVEGKLRRLVTRGSEGVFEKAQAKIGARFAADNQKISAALGDARAEMFGEGGVIPEFERMLGDNKQMAVSRQPVGKGALKASRKEAKGGFDVIGGEEGAREMARRVETVMSGTFDTSWEGMQLTQRKLGEMYAENPQGGARDVLDMAYKATWDGMRKMAGGDPKKLSLIEESYQKYADLKTQQSNFKAFTREYAMDTPTGEKKAASELTRSTLLDDPGKVDALRYFAREAGLPEDALMEQVVAVNYASGLARPIVSEGLGVAKSRARAAVGATEWLARKVTSPAQVLRNYMKQQGSKMTAAESTAARKLFSNPAIRDLFMARMMGEAPQAQQGPTGGSASSLFSGSAPTAGQASSEGGGGSIESLWSGPSGAEGNVSELISDLPSEADAMGQLDVMGSIPEEGTIMDLTDGDFSY